MNEPKIGDKVRVFLTRHTKKIAAKGEIKEIKKDFGRKVYLISNVTAEDFWVRTLK